MTAQEPWDIRKDDSREEDTVAAFIIFCEDRVSEPFYFRGFTVPGKIKVNAIEDQKQHWHNLNNALADCEKNGLLEKSGGSYKVKENSPIQIWSAYDRDMESEVIDEALLKNDINFSTAIQTASDIGIKVAWSNDAFELWVLLHFEAIPTGARLHRNYIYQRLTEIFKNLPNQSPELQELTSKDNFDYKGYFKRRTHFAIHVLPLLTAQRRDVAIANAFALEAAYQDTTPFHERNPCTRVHHLVNELLAVL